jgi:CHASE2 domain-containing sensor protein
VKRRIPIDATGAYLINYRHALGGFVNYGYKETFDDLYHRFVDKAPGPIPQLTGRILLIGQTADGLTDFGPTPFSRLTPLVLVHANVIENVLNEDYARRAETWPLWLGGLAATVASLGFFARRKVSGADPFLLGRARGLCAGRDPVLGQVQPVAAAGLAGVGLRLRADLHDGPAGAR